MTLKTKLTNWWLPIILIIAAVMRLYHLDFSFANDELSALSRLRYDSFNDLIWKGVGEDFHPAFVQIFLYIWSYVFGISEWITRMPFVLFGVASVYLTYRIGLELFNEQTALLSAASVSTLSFFILYSQLARPYSPGLFFVLTSAYAWIKILRGPPSNKWIIIAALATALAMYTHYFSFMTVGIIWLLSLLRLNRFNRKPFLIASIIIGFLFSPHIGITLLQLSYGGVGSWLGAPTPEFWTDFSLYIFNSSFYLTVFYVLLVVIIAAVNIKQFKVSFWHLFCLFVFLSPIIIGYVYSIYINPVLQYSTLLFGTPFFLILLFSFVNNISNKLVFSTFLGVLLVGTMYSTAVETKYYQTEHFGVFKELASKIKEWDNKYGSENITRTACVHGDYYLNYYLDKQNHSSNFSTYFTLGDSAMVNFVKIIDQSTSDYFAYCWSTMNVQPETFELIRVKYPRLEEAQEHFNSGVYLFSKAGEDERKPLFNSGNLLIVQSPFVQPLIDEQLISSGEELHYTMKPEHEYAITFECKASDLGLKGNELLVIQADIEEDSTSDLHLVYSLDKVDGTNEWHANKLHPIFFNNSHLTQNLILSRKLPAELNPDDIIKVYLWKTSLNSVSVSNYSIAIFSE